MSDKPGPLKNLTTGRTLRRGLTWRSGLFSVVATMAVLFVFNLVLQQLQTEYRLVAIVTDVSTVQNVDECVWTVDLHLTNESDRDMSVVSAGLNGVDGSERGIIASVEVAETVERTYRHQLTSCDPATAIPAVDDLVVRYRLTGTTRLRTTNARIDAPNSAG